MSRFSGKVAIITGAASGIGKEIALRFAAQGGIPVIADLNLDAADATVPTNVDDLITQAKKVTAATGAGGPSRI